MSEEFKWKPGFERYAAPERLLTIKEVGEMLSVSKDTVLKLLKEEKLQRVRIRSSVRITRTSVQNLIERGKKA